MPAGAEDDDARTVAAPAQALDSEHPEHPHHPHHVLIEPEEDRWKWRRKIREDPRKLFFYRWAVGIAGTLMIALGIITGPLPGPGGIPLVLLGLAIWASEFEWAHKVMLWFKAQLHRYRGWPARYKVLFWICFLAVCGLLGYLYLVVIGYPDWAPQFLHAWAHRLPGVD